MENWRDIKDYEGLYQVSNWGRVRNVRTGKILKGRIQKSGYLLIALYKDGKQKWVYIHRLVAQTFIPNPDNLSEVNHKDENKINNCVGNLEWCSRKYNNNYGTRLKKVSEKNTNGKCSKRVFQFSKTGEFIREWLSSHEIQRQLGYNRRHICSCCLGKFKTAYGFIWKYKEVS